VLCECGAESIEKFLRPVIRTPTCLPQSAIEKARGGSILALSSERFAFVSAATPLQAPTALKRLVNISCRGGTIFGYLVTPRTLPEVGILIHPEYRQDGPSGYLKRLELVDFEITADWIR
jgi:hypothetical protein